MSASRFGCRPWICSSVTTLTGASASIARSSVFVAATVMVSSDCTGVAPIWARAFSDRRRGSPRIQRFQFAFGLPPAIGRTAGMIRVHVCAKPGPAKRNANESIDAPKIKARERLAPSAMTTPTL